MGDRAVGVDQNASVDLISFLKAILTATTGVECVKRLGSFCCLTMQEVLRLLACFWLTGAGWEVLRCTLI
jgi:hypothetical protein